MDVQPAAARNGLLSSLAPDDLGALAPCLQFTSLSAGQWLHETGAPIDHVFFINSGVATIVVQTDPEVVVEVGLIGREGVTGIEALLGAAASPHSYLMRIGGGALRIAVKDLRSILDRREAVRMLLLDYVQAAGIEIDQTVGCNARHAIEPRLARHLLMVHDRVDGDELHLTHECLSRMLGVRRAGITLAAGALEDAGLIRQSWGRLTVLDRSALERVSCACYALAAPHRRMAQRSAPSGAKADRADRNTAQARAALPG